VQCVDKRAGLNTEIDVESGLKMLPKKALLVLQQAHLQQLPKWGKQTFHCKVKARKITPRSVKLHYDSLSPTGC